jgi:hypothetical protein
VRQALKHSDTLRGVWRIYLAHPDGVLGGQARDEEDGATAGEVDRAEAVGLGDAKGPVEEALLTEEVLVIRLVARLGPAAAQKDHAARECGRRTGALLQACHEPLAVLAVQRHRHLVRLQSCFFFFFFFFF